MNISKLVILVTILGSSIGCSHRKSHMFNGQVSLVRCRVTTSSSINGVVYIDGCNCDTPLIIDKFDAKTKRISRTIYCDGKIS